MYLTNKYFRNKDSKVEFIRTVREAFDLTLKEAKEIVDSFNPDQDEVLSFPKVKDLTYVYNPDAFKLIQAEEPASNHHNNLIIETKELLKKAVDQSNYLMVRSLLNTLEEQLELG